MELLGSNPVAGQQRRTMDPSDEAVSLPVFAFPNNLLFRCWRRGEGSTAHLTQTIKLCNPYSIPLSFRIFSTRSEDFICFQSKGTVKAMNCVELTLRLNPGAFVRAATVEQRTFEARLRIQVYHVGQERERPRGRLDVPATILVYDSFDHLPELKQNEDVTGASSSSAGQNRSGGSGNARVRAAPAEQVGGHGPVQAPPPHNYVTMGTALICVLALLLPSEGQESALLPSYIFLTENQKLLIAYTLGLVTMALFSRGP